MALGAGIGHAHADGGAYSVFANGGYRVNPWLIAKVTDQKGKVLMPKHPHPELDESVRADQTPATPS
jgi:penicillin-binding protein 1A